MNGLRFCRAASKADLHEILRLDAQPGLDVEDDSLSEAERTFESQCTTSAWRGVLSRAPCTVVAAWLISLRPDSRRSPT